MFYCIWYEFLSLTISSFTTKLVNGASVHERYGHTLAAILILKSI